MTYRLPEALGGAEVEGRIIRTGLSVGVGARPVLLANVDGVGEVSVPLGAVTEVRPPLPPEPPEGAYAIGDYVAVRIAGHLAPRRGCTWFSTGGEDDRPYRWSSWDELWQHVGGDEVTIYHLVRDTWTGDLRKRPGGAS